MYPSCCEKRLPAREQKGQCHRQPSVMISSVNLYTQTSAFKFTATYCLSCCSLSVCGIAWENSARERWSLRGKQCCLRWQEYSTTDDAAARAIMSVCYVANSLGIVLFQLSLVHIYFRHHPALSIPLSRERPAPKSLSRQPRPKSWKSERVIPGQQHASKQQMLVLVRRFRESGGGDALFGTALSWNYCLGTVNLAIP